MIIINENLCVNTQYFLIIIFYNIFFFKLQIILLLLKYIKENDRVNVSTVTFLKYYNKLKSAIMI